VTELLDEQLAAVRAVFAKATGVTIEAFEADRLTITERPQPAPWPFAALASGLLPVCSYAVAYPAGLGISGP
jgi:hypothetical protein